MSLRIACLCLILMVSSMGMSQTAHATFMVCPSKQQALNLLQGALNILRAQRDNNGDASSASVKYADCRADRQMTDPGDLISKGHYVLDMVGIANSSKYLKQIRDSIVSAKDQKIFARDNGKEIQVKVGAAWLHRLKVNDRFLWVISVK